VKYALLFSYDPSEIEPEEAEIPEWMAFDQAVRDAGVLVHEAGLWPASTARTVRVRDGRAETSDGGVTTSGPVLAGYYVLDVADADVATEWAQRVPTVTYGAVEVRPVVEFEA
jgi:hypothetical protein